MKQFLSRLTKFVAILAVSFIGTFSEANEESVFLDKKLNTSEIQRILPFVANRVVLLASRDTMEKPTSKEAKEFNATLNYARKAVAEGRDGLFGRLRLGILESFETKPNRTGVGYCSGFALSPTLVLTAKHCKLGIKANDSYAYVVKYDLEQSAWKYSKFTQIVTMGEMPKTSLAADFVFKGSDIAVVKIDPSEPLELSDSRIDLRLGSNGSDRCFVFNWFNFDPTQEILTPESKELEMGITYVEMDPNFPMHQRAMSIGMKLLDRRGNYQETEVSKPGHIKKGDSGGAVFCTDDNARISIAGVVSFTNPFFDQIAGISLVNDEVISWLESIL